VPVKMLPPVIPDWPEHLPPIGVRISDRQLERWRKIDAGSRGARRRGKLQDWVKYCSRCGEDISETPRGIRRCASCLSLEEERRAGVFRPRCWVADFPPLPTKRAALEPARP
jgi:hypothetical protein